MKKKGYFIRKSTVLIFLMFFCSKLQAASITDAETVIGDLFSSLTDSDEGTTSFRSLLIPFGGRTESLGNAYTGLCDDISYLRFNPAAGSIQKETQIALFHNSWIADSKLETLGFTTRFKNTPHLSAGGYLSCFYMPFTEYNFFGDRVAASYYTETVAALNASYNLLAGYDFKGLAAGITLKAGWRGMPDYTDNDSGAIIAGSGLSQSALAVMADIGFMLQFNFLKYYSSRDPNVRIGISAQNVGVSITGFGDSIKLDDPLPTTVSAGISLKFIKPITLSFDFVQPLNLMDFSHYRIPYFNTGLSIQFASFISFLAGFSLKGANPRISSGFEFEVAKIRLNMNYTLDLTTSLAPLNRISLSAKLLLGDKGRSITDAQVDEYYQLGLKYYADAKWEDAIIVWQEALKLNKRFDPAIQGIQSARYQIEMFQQIRESLMLD
ncbi:Uncharacterised protein family (UPF0164) [Treponema bryantii]|uniref:Uncharacterized protein family (UPF0164) n=1 Tax=Treponema bryantii TaxID=163 RepID=A0A1H9I3F0_9SPIR|nr:UPF0164 family protein [Treponema bryantii]SEQ69109.1 Uncharacterised protein family (UPF0164) [Treponema bryantii]